jgi:electron transfer flavoprotein alpha subunit
MTTLLVAEHDNKTVKDSTSKALSAAKALGADVHVLVAGKDCKAAADAAAKLDGVKKVLVADAAPYEHQLAEPLAALIVSLAGSYDAIVSPSRRCSMSCRFPTSQKWCLPILSSDRSTRAMRSKP